MHYREYYAEIDWDDFVVVQIIDFDEDDDRYADVDFQQLGIEDVSTKIDRVDQEIKRELFEMEGVKAASEVEPGMKIVTDYKKKRVENREATQVCPK